MNLSLLLILISATSLMAGQTVSNSGIAKSDHCSLSNSAVISGKVTISCNGIGQQQGNKIIDILNRLLAGMVTQEEVNHKLDEILAAVNRPTTRSIPTYDRVQILTALKNRPKHKFQVDSVSGDVEARQFAAQWISLLEEAGWEFVPHSADIQVGSFISFGDPWDGIRIEGWGQGNGLFAKDQECEIVKLHSRIYIDDAPQQLADVLLPLNISDLAFTTDNSVSRELVKIQVGHMPNPDLVTAARHCNSAP